MLNESNDKRGNKTMPTLFAGHQFGLIKSSLEKSDKEKVKTPKTHFLCKANKLLEKRKHQRLIAQCIQLLEFSDDQVTAYITPLLNTFVEFTQNLPETRNSYFSNVGGMIDHAFMRTTSALSMCRAYFSANAPDKNHIRLSSTETLWMYALFTAGILNGIGKVFSDLIVELYDENDKHLDRWNPFEGSMLETKAHSYEYEFEEARHIDLFSRRLSVLLARQLMPAQGFAWLSSDKEVLSLWLALLEDNQRDAGTLGPFMVRADALAINTYFDEKRMQREYADLDNEARQEVEELEDKEEEKEVKKEEEDDLKEEQENKEKLQEKLDKEKIQLKFSATFTPPQENQPPIPGSEADKAEKRNPDTQAGIEFLKWLNNQMKSQRLEFNDAIFFLPTGAIFLPTALFEEFKKKNPHYKSYLDVIESFNKLQLHAKGYEKNDIHTFMRNNSEHPEKIQGIVLTNAQIVLPKIVNIKLPNGRTQTLSSSDLPHYTYLLEALQPAGKGLAKNAEKTIDSESPRFTNRGLFRR